jgi:hypothetical protein
MDAQDSVLFAAYNEETGWSKVNLRAKCKPLVRVPNSAKVGKSARISRIGTRSEQGMPYEHDNTQMYAMPGRKNGY